MNESLFIRLQVSGLFSLHFVGMVTHVAIDSLLLPIQLEKMPETEANAVREVLGGSVIPWALLVITTLTFLPGFLTLLTAQKIVRWIVVVVGTISVLGLGLDYIGHLFEGQVATSLCPIIIGTLPGVIGVLAAIRWARTVSDATEV